MHKCMKCPNPATLHITEVMGQGKFEELHFCESCAQKYIHEATPAAAGKPEAAVEADEAIFGNAECPNCGIKFVDFRNTGRLGCAHDYEIFRDDLLPLLENIHGDPRHCGKTPRRLPQTQKLESELTRLRTDLKSAVHREDYEAAAQIRDQIRSLEEAP
jgi:protein arginine kinase activator